MNRHNIILDEWDNIGDEITSYSGWKPTLWHIIISFINSKYVYENDQEGEDQIFTRRELISEVEKWGYIQVGNKYSSMDQYRNTLKNAGYIETVRRGVYKILKEIPHDLTVSDARSESKATRLEFDINIEFQKLVPVGFIKKKEFMV